MRGHRRVVAAVASALFAGAAAAVAIATGGSGREDAVLARTTTLRASHGPAGVGLALGGRTLVAHKANGNRAIGSLGGGDEVIAPLTGSLTPVAAATPDGRVVYSTWRQLARIEPDARGQGMSVGQPLGVPSVRLFDPSSGKDALLATGAASPAVSTTGAVAYLAGENELVRQNVDYGGRLVVADSPDAKPRVWTSAPARYLPYAWAGSELLVHRGIPDSEGADLYAYSGPDESHLLAPDAYAIAVSPDGSEVLAAVGVRTLEVIRVSDGAVEDSLSLDVPGPATPGAVMYGGSWLGERIVANSDRGLLVLNVRGGLHVESLYATPSLPHGIYEPTFVDETHVQGWADVGRPRATRGGVGEPEYDNALVGCDLATGSCDVAQPSPARHWTRWVTNPSR